MATLQSPEEHPSSVRVTGPNVTEDNLDDIMKGSSPITADDSESRPLRALRAVRRPPACLLSSSLNFVLLQRHNALPVVHDIESFFCVLLLFFFSYAGPLSKAGLENADKGGFVHFPGSGRLRHMRPRPSTYIERAEGNTRNIVSAKDAMLNEDGDVDFVQTRKELAST